MDVIRVAGVDVPVTFERDEQGRRVIEFIPGRIALDARVLGTGELILVGALVRTIHDASSQFAPVPAFIDDVLLPATTEELICTST